MNNSLRELFIELCFGKTIRSSRYALETYCFVLGGNEFRRAFYVCDV